MPPGQHHRAESRPVFDQSVFSYADVKVGHFASSCELQLSDLIGSNNNFQTSHPVFSAVDVH